MQKKVVCMFAPTPFGGHARYAWELVTALVRHPRGDFRYELITSTDLDASFRDTGYPIHPILKPIRERSTFRTRLGWTLNRLTHYPVREFALLHWLRGRPDVAAVHLQEWKPWLATALIQSIQRLGKKVFYTVHNVLPHRYPAGIPKRLMDHWIRRACGSCDGLFVHTDRLARELQDFLGDGHPPIHVVPHGVWTSDAAAERPLYERLAQKRLLFFGAIRRNKGLDLLLRSLPQLPGYRLTVAGEPCDPDYFRAEIEPRIAELRRAGAQVDLLARYIPESELAALFASHSAIVLPYTRGFVAQSGVVFMALAHGLPVVSSTAGGLRELLGEFGIGTTFEADAPDSLAAAVEQLHASSRLNDIERQIAAARRRFTWHSAAGATIAGYMNAFQTSAESHDCALGTTPAH